MAITHADVRRLPTIPMPDLSSLRRILGHRRNKIGLSILIPIVTLAVVAPWLPIPAPLETNPSATILAPSLDHPLGTDSIGRDVFSRILTGARTSLFVGFVASTAAITIGMFLGTVAGFLGRAVDGVIMMIVDIFLAFPGLLLTIAMVAVFGAGLWQVILAITISDIPRTIRLQRSLVLSLKTRPYIDAARMAHAPTTWLLIKHVVPNTIAPMLLVAGLYMANAILTEASLSFLGLGIVPPEPSWGNIIREGQPYLQNAWWISTFPGVAIVLVSVGLHFVSDGVRESLDPSMRS